MSVLLGVSLLGAVAGCGGQEEKPPPVKPEPTQFDRLNEIKIMDNHEKVNFGSTFDLNTKVAYRNTAFKLPPQFNHYMVLQANAVNCFYGEYDTDGGIAVQIKDENSDFCAEYYGEVKNGAFELYADPVPYGENYTVSLYTPSGYTSFTDVAFGEVFLMGGQSNMGMTVAQCLDPASTDADPVCVYQDIIDSYDNMNVRSMSVWPNMSDTEVDKLSENAASGWKYANSGTIGEMSACGFFFAKRMQEMYGIPVGFITSCMGGTATCMWIPAAEYKNADPTYSGQGETNKPSARYNSMIHPLRKTTVRGVCWYQGEGQNVEYFKNTSLLIAGWRRAFGRELPFNVVELPRYIHGSHDEWFSIRSQQRRLADELTNVSMSVNIDRGIFSRNVTGGIYNPGILAEDGIHCPDKEQVGNRAADAFMKKFLNAAGTLTPPQFQKAEKTDDGILLTYAIDESPLALGEKLCGFEVSENGKIWKYAAPSLVGNDKVLLTCEDSVAVQYVRYGATYACKEVFGADGTPDKIENLVCLYNTRGYPADQFYAELGA